MLERPTIRIEPLRIGPLGHVRAISCGTTQAPVGMAHRIARGGFLGPRGYSVTEAPDDSLLLTVRKRWWGAAPCTFDSEGRPLAILRGVVLLWPDLRTLAELIPGRQVTSVHSSSGVELAQWNINLGSTVVRFHPRVADEPLVKMAILAAALMRT